MEPHSDSFLNQPSLAPDFKPKRHDVYGKEERDHVKTGTARMGKKY